MPFGPEKCLRDIVGILLMLVQIRGTPLNIGRASVHRVSDERQVALPRNHAPGDDVSVFSCEDRVSDSGNIEQS
jgi:hypothetical protein